MSSPLQIFIEDTGVYIYDHVGAEYLTKTINSIRSAIRDLRDQFIDEPDYLAAAILCEMFKKHKEHCEMINEQMVKERVRPLYPDPGRPGDRFGIGNSRYGVYYLITINWTKGTVKLEPYPVDPDGEDLLSFKEERERLGIRQCEIEELLKKGIRALSKKARLSSPKS